MWHLLLSASRWTANRRETYEAPRGTWWLGLCVLGETGSDGWSHSSTGSLPLHSVGNVKHPRRGRLHAQDPGRRQGRSKPTSSRGGQEAYGGKQTPVIGREGELANEGLKLSDKQWSTGAMMCLVIEIQTCLNWCGETHSKHYYVIHAQSLSCVRRFATLWTPVRLLCPWGFPDKNTRVVCHFLLQRTFLTKDWVDISCFSCILY